MTRHGGWRLTRAEIVGGLAGLAAVIGGGIYAHHASNSDFHSFVATLGLSVGLGLLLVGSLYRIQHTVEVQLDDVKEETERFQKAAIRFQTELDQKVEKVDARLGQIIRRLDTNPTTTRDEVVERAVRRETDPLVAEIARIRQQLNDIQAPRREPSPRPMTASDRAGTVRQRVHSKPERSTKRKTRSFLERSSTLVYERVVSPLLKSLVEILEFVIIALIILLPIFAVLVGTVYLAWFVIPGGHDVICRVGGRKVKWGQAYYSLLVALYVAIYDVWTKRHSVDWYRFILRSPMVFVGTAVAMGVGVVVGATVLWLF